MYIGHLFGPLHCKFATFTANDSARSAIFCWLALCGMMEMQACGLHGGRVPPDFRCSGMDAGRPHVVWAAVPDGKMHCGAMPDAARCIGLRSVLHEPAQRTAFSAPASPAYPRSGTSLPEGPTSQPHQPHYESQEAAPALPAQDASRGETASCVPFPLAPCVAGQSRSAWREISSPCAP